MKNMNSAQRCQRPLTFIRQNLREIFYKTWNGTNGILRGPEETDSWTNLKLKISCQTPWQVAGTLSSATTENCVQRRKIRLIESNAKCRHLKKLTCIFRQVFICPPSPPVFMCIINSTSLDEKATLSVVTEIIFAEVYKNCQALYCQLKRRFNWYLSILLIPFFCI